VKRFIEELRRRNVLRTGAAYFVGAWLVAQIAALLADTYAAPAWVMRAVVGALALGLPATLLLAWVYAFTPAGLLREADLPAEPAERLQVSRRFDRILIALLGASLLYFVADKVWLSGDGTGSADATRPSVAVLPFANRSEEAADRYFVDGIHDDILTQLAKISALRVISRTSVERFRDTDRPIAEIAAELGATRILEGGVQRAGERVRVTVQLIDTASDAHLWAETYDRELTAVNVFAIQSEIAGAIAVALQAEILPLERARVDAVATRNLEAWEAFQLGRQRMATRNSQTLHEARAFLERAIALDPGFAQAHALLADVWVLLAYYGEPVDDALRRAETLAKRALELAPDLAEAVTSVAGIAEELGDFAAAESGYRRAIELNPNYVTALHWYSGLLLNLGRPQEALQHAEQALQLDPLSAPVNAAFAGALDRLGRPEDALARYQKVLEIDPRMSNAYTNMANLQTYAFARPDEAIAILRELDRVDPGYPHRVLRAMNYLALGDTTTARRLLDRVSAGEEPDALIVNAFMAASSGDWAEARRLAEFAVAGQPGNVMAQQVMRNADLHDGRVAAALARYAAEWPELVRDSEPAIHQGNWIAAIDIVPLLQAAGETAQANRLLDVCERFIGTRMRLGIEGYGIADVQIHALRGDTRAALVALRKAREAGWSRGWHYFRNDDPNLAAIREEPEFQAVFAEIAARMAALRAAMPPDPEAG